MKLELKKQLKELPGKTQKGIVWAQKQKRTWDSFQIAEQERKAQALKQKTVRLKAETSFYRAKAKLEAARQRRKSDGFGGGITGVF